MLPVFIGIGLGVLLGSIPVFVPGFPAALKLGLAGGPLIMALILGRIGSIGKLYWFMPPSANLALRELGIVPVPLGRWPEIRRRFYPYTGGWRRAKLDWLWCPDHRRSADYCWYSGADVSQNELPDHVRDAGRFHDRSSGAGVC